jgi:ABC-type glycerol-3-phosphate transport system substrate-binding protein
MSVNVASQALRLPLGRRGRRTVVSIAAAALAVVAGVGASGGQAAGTRHVARAAAPQITVWVDSVRLPAAKLYVKTHPKVKVHIVTYDGDANGSGTLKTKILLYNRTGHGWPDVVFSEDNTDASWAAGAPFNFAATLNQGLVPQKTLNHFAAGSLNWCTEAGALVCMRNDLAQNVLWYNSKLMKQFGYSVPSTWQQYAAIGTRVAKQHPGYVIGTMGDSFAPFDYLWPAQCPVSDLVAANQVKIALSDSHCTRMAKLLDPLLANKSLSTDTVFSAGFAKNTASKVLMLVGPSWYGGSLFHDTFKTPAGQIAAAPPLKWQGQSKATTGMVGGGLWFVSRHSAHVQLATNFVTYVTTSMAVQAHAPGYPAYAPAAHAWLNNVKSSGYYANNIGPALTAAAQEVWTGWSPTKFSVQSIWASTVVPSLTKGSSFSATLSGFQSQLKNYAQSQGYSVTG